MCSFCGSHIFFQRKYTNLTEKQEWGSEIRSPILLSEYFGIFTTSFRKWGSEIRSPILLSEYFDIFATSFRKWRSEIRSPFLLSEFFSIFNISNKPNYVINSSLLDWSRSNGFKPRLGLTNLLSTLTDFHSPYPWIESIVTRLVSLSWNETEKILQVLGHNLDGNCIWNNKTFSVKTLTKIELSIYNMSDKVFDL